MNYCDKCGGPRWRDSEKYAVGLNGRRWQRWDTADGCRLCWLALPPLSRLRPFEWRGISVDDANSTADSTATSTWLPPGAREALQVTASRPEMALQMWLRECCMWGYGESWRRAWAD